MAILVLLPGLDGTGRLFEGFVAAIGAKFESLVISYPTDAVLGYEELENFVRSRLPRGNPFFLLAESFSGPIGISIAASPPAELRGLILCCSFAANPVPWFKPFRFGVHIAPVRGAPVALLSFFLLGRFATAALRNALVQSLGSVSSAVLRARARAALSVDRSAALRAISLPVLYLRGTKDRLIPSSSAKFIRSLAQQTQIVDLEAPHFLLQVAPATAARAVNEFAEACSSGL